MGRHRLFNRALLFATLLSSFLFGVALYYFGGTLSETMLVLLFAALGPIVLVLQILITNGVTPGPVHVASPQAGVS